MNRTEDVMEIDLQELFGVLLHWIWAILLTAVITGVAGFCVSNFVITPQYQSTTKVYILNKKENTALTYSDMQLGTQLTKDYAQLITSRDVLEDVIDACNLADSYGSLAGRVTVQNITDTRIIAITVEDPDPVMAQRIAEELRTKAAAHIKQVMDIEAVNVAEEANLPKSPASPSVMKWTALGFLLGFFLCAAVIVLRFLLDDTVKTSEDVEKYLGLSTLALIPIMEDEKTIDKKRRRGNREYQEQIGELEDLDADEAAENAGRNGTESQEKAGKQEIKEGKEA